MAKTSAANTGGSQFFLIPNDSTPSWLDGVHTVFGEVTSGCEHVTAISGTETGQNDRPTQDVELCPLPLSVRRPSLGTSSGESQPSAIFHERSMLGL